MNDPIKNAPRAHIVKKVADLVEPLLDDRGFLTVPFVTVSDAAREAVGGELVAWVELLDGWHTARNRLFV